MLCNSDHTKEEIVCVCIVIQIILKRRLYVCIVIQIILKRRLYVLCLRGGCVCFVILITLKRRLCVFCDSEYAKEETPLTNLFTLNVSKFVKHSLFAMAFFVIQIILNRKLCELSNCTQSG